jgi:hypothetical protein
MALGKSTKPSNESFDIPDLELPIDREFHALPPKVNLQEYCRLNEQFRKLFPKGIPTEEDRLARKVSEDFVL